MLALSTRKVVLSLFAGVVAGALVAHLPQVVDGQILDATTALVGYLVDAVLPGLSTFEPALDGDGSVLFGAVEGDPSILDTSHLVITAFSLLVAGMVGILSRSGGTRALVAQVERLARGPRGAQVAAWLSGAIVFFDDYANCLVVGSAMGPLFDRFRVSRAKLAYIVDSTAAPVASLAIVSTWVGYEVGLIGDELVKAGSDAPAFSVFLAALPYRFYGFVTLAMVGAVAISGRDFGPMHTAEAAARLGARRLNPDRGGRVGKAWAAAIPVVLLVALTFGWLIADGATAVTASGARLSETPWFDVIGAADPFMALLVGSAAAIVVAAVLALVTGTLTLSQTPRAAWAGMAPVLEALGVLFLAWALGNAMGDTGAARHLRDVIAPADTFAYQGAPVTVSWHAEGTASDAVARIRDASGQVVHRESLGTLEVGEGALTWDGASTAGVVAPAGTYRLTVDATDEAGETVPVMVRGTARFPTWLLPSVVFVVAAGTAFATGTSFGTMGILIPLVVPLGVGLEVGDPGPILLGSVAAVLAGAILGDHASPISDTTVLSALGAGVDLVTHVRTQLPYALTCGVISLLVGYVPGGLGVSPWLLIPLGCAMAVGVVYVLGRPSDPPAEAGPDETLIHPDKPGGLAYER